MDNLQREYLLRLASAKEKALAGDINNCLDTCFELRLKADLAFYTRGLVCLTICDLVNLERLPEKLDLAVEALRIATSLKKEDMKDSFWVAEYVRLEEDAKKAVEMAEAEERQYIQNLVDPQERAIEEDMDEMSLADRDIGQPEVMEEDSEKGAWFRVEDNSEDDTDIVGMPNVENLFTVNPAKYSNEGHIMDDSEEAEGSVSKISSTGSHGSTIGPQ